MNQLTEEQYIELSAKLNGVFSVEDLKLQVIIGDIKVFKKVDDYLMDTMSDDLEVGYDILSDMLTEEQEGKQYGSTLEHLIAITDGIALKDGTIIRVE